jgi:hypothetical protein
MFLSKISGFWQVFGILDKNGGVYAKGAKNAESAKADTQRA